MKLTADTISILKNFGNINQGIYFTKGRKLKTVSPHMNIIANAILSEDIPCDFGIYDLNNFLSVLSLYKTEPTFEFDDKHIYIIGNNSRSRSKYRFCDPSMIVLPPEKELVMPKPEVTFDLSSDDFNWVLRVSSVLSSPNIAFESNGNKVSIVSMDINDDSAHTNALEITEGNGIKYMMLFKTENLTKILPGSYTVEVSTKGISHFTNNNYSLEYYVSIETGSYYENN